MHRLRITQCLHRHPEPRRPGANGHGETAHEQAHAARSPSSPARPRASGPRSPGTWPRRAPRSSSTTPPARKAPTGSSPRSRAQGGKAVAVQANVAKKADDRAPVRRDEEGVRPARILVNNAGIYEFSPLEEVTAEHFHRQFDLNVLGLAARVARKPSNIRCRGRQHHQHQLGRQHADAGQHARSTAPPRRPSMRSPGRWPRNWARARSA